MKNCGSGFRATLNFRVLETVVTHPKELLSDTQIYKLCPLEEYEAVGYPSLSVDGNKYKRLNRGKEGARCSASRHETVAFWNTSNTDTESKGRNKVSILGKWSFYRGQ